MTEYVLLDSLSLTNASCRAMFLSPARCRAELARVLLRPTPPNFFLHTLMRLQQPYSRDPLTTLSSPSDVQEMMVKLLRCTMSAGFVSSIRRKSGIQLGQRICSSNTSPDSGESKLALILHHPHPGGWDIHLRLRRWCSRTKAADFSHCQVH